MDRAEMDTNLNDAHPRPLPAIEITSVPRAFTCQECPTLQANISRALALAEAHEKRGDRTERDIGEIKGDVKCLAADQAALRQTMANGGIPARLGWRAWVTFSLIVLAAAQGEAAIAILRALGGILTGR